MDLIFDSLLPTLIPVIIGIAVPYVMGGIKTFAAFIDGFSAPIQQLLVTVIAWGMVELGALLNVILPTDIELLTSGDAAGALAAAVAFATHAGKRKRE